MSPPAGDEPGNAMKKQQSKAGEVWGARVWKGCLLAWVLGVAGCASVLDSVPTAAGPAHKPKNIYQGAEKLPRDLKRVAVLPLRITQGNTAMEMAREGLQSALVEELSKAGRFEAFVVTPERLKAWTGRSDWSTSDPLPEGFLESIREATACDAVLFCQLTGYRAYPPLAIGWRLRMVDTEGTRVWWAADEFFDSAEESVATAARRYHMARAERPSSLADPRQILYSPSRFGTFTAYALAATCPGR